jgi:hypothetical protein
MPITGQAADIGRQESTAPFRVPLFLHALGGLIHRGSSILRWLANHESQQLADQLRQYPVQSPIYVCGLARSGSTMLHHLLAASSCVATHRVRDYPLVFTPYWWRQATAGRANAALRERLHQDGILISPNSPEALEEMLWMAFFPRCHDVAASQIMTADERHPEFEAFYDRHLRKLLLAEGGQRYAAKANYHVARLSYLLRLYPDARFVIPVRSPASHVASLLRQHRWFCRGQSDHPRALAFMQRTGHFEFGLDRRPMHLGDAPRVCEIENAWSSGDEVRGLAMYWDMVYSYLHRTLAADARLRSACRIVSFESLCSHGVETIRQLYDHCGLADGDVIAERFAPTLRSPPPRASELSDADLAIVHHQTASTAADWGY